MEWGILVTRTSPISPQIILVPAHPMVSNIRLVFKIKAPPSLITLHSVINCLPMVIEVILSGLVREAIFHPTILITAIQVIAQDSAHRLSGGIPRVIFGIREDIPVMGEMRDDRNLLF